MVSTALAHEVSSVFRGIVAAIGVVVPSALLDRDADRADYVIVDRYLTRC